MKITSSKKSNKKNFSKPLKIKNDDILCKDGFCSLPNQQENSGLNEADVNIFDAI